MKKLLATTDDLSLLATRLILGGVMFAHGAQLTLGWFGGVPLSETAARFTQGMGIPTPVAYFSILTLFLASLGLLSGFLTRLSALGLIGYMAVAGSKHLEFGLFMNWFGNQKGQGFEFHLLAIAAALPLVWRGAGALSFDGLLLRWLARPVRSSRVVTA